MMVDRYPDLRFDFHAHNDYEVLQIDIHVDLPFRRFQYDRTNIVNVLLGSLSKLFGDMLIRALAKQFRSAVSCSRIPWES